MASQEMSITANSVETFSEGAEQILRAEIPLTDKLFDFDKTLAEYKKVEFAADGEPCGALLYDVFNVSGNVVFFISCLALDARKCGEVGAFVYDWIEREARKLKCNFLQFDSPRKGMLKHAQTYGWHIVSVKYGKAL